MKSVKRDGTMVHFCFRCSMTLDLSQCSALSFPENAERAHLGGFLSFALNSAWVCSLELSLSIEADPATEHLRL